jgi:hypothetical protein
MSFASLSSSAINLPWPLNGWLERAVADLVAAPGLPKLDLTKPKGEAALMPPDSVSWRIFKNPVSLFIGGVSAVILELAEPRVRSGVWDHTTFRKNPLTRLRPAGTTGGLYLRALISSPLAHAGGVTSSLLTRIEQNPAI